MRIFENDFLQKIIPTLLFFEKKLDNVERSSWKSYLWVILRPV